MYCIVLNCQTPSRAKGRSSCRIPAVITNQGEEAQRLSEERRRLWLAAINRGELTESALKHGRVCGSHFVSGKAAPPWNRASVDWVPTLNLRHQTKNVDEERTQERAWRRFAKRRRKEARHDHIEAQKTEEKSSSGVQRGGNTTVRSTSKRARVSNSLQGDGEDSYAADDHGGEGDSTPPMMGVLGFSKKTTLALLNRMFAEELLSELERRNIEVKLAGGDRPRGRDDLEHVLREVMTREYEEVEGGNVNMDMSNTSSTSQHGCSNTSSSLEHEAGSSEVLSRPHDDQATTHDVQEPSVKATDMDVSETSSTTSVQVKKEPVEDDFEYCVATSSLSSDSVASTTEPSTSQTQNPSGIKGGSQRRSPRRAQKLAVRIKTEPSVEEETEDEQQDLRSEHCPTSPGQLSQELDQVEVSTEEEDTKPSSAEPVKINWIYPTRVLPETLTGSNGGKMFPCPGIQYEHYKAISTHLYYFPKNGMHDVSSGHHTVFSKHCLKWFKVGANSTLPEKYGRGLCCKCKQFIRGVKQSDKRNAKLSEEVWRRKLYMSRMLDERSKERLESYDGEEGDDQHEEQTGGIDGDGRREAGMDDTGI